MKVFITGTSGFVGSHLLPHLIKLNYEVHALERYMTGRYVRGKQDGSVNVVYADLNDHVAIREAIVKIKPEFVIHLAAISPVAYSFEHPFEVIETNFVASVNLAEANRKYNPKLEHFIAAGTSEEYGNQEQIPIPETADLRPTSPYAVSKVAMDRYLQYMRDAYDFPMTVARPFNTYGRRRNKFFVVERILSQMLNDCDTVKLGDPTPVRDLMYISDHVNAYLTCLGNNKAKKRTFNFCTGHGASILNLVEVAKQATGYKGKITWNTVNRPLDINSLIGDNRKALELLGWRPTTSLENGIRQTIENLE